MTISIHAPIVGCDIKNMTITPIFEISIHAPIVGCDDNQREQANKIANISIHAPIVGCDKDKYIF